MTVLEKIGEGLWNAFQMAWEVGWALVLGFLFSGIVQAWIPRSRMESALGGRDLRAVARATGLGAASSSCSYAAVAIAKSMFQKGASFAPGTKTSSARARYPRGLLRLSTNSKTACKQARNRSQASEARALPCPHPRAEFAR